MAWRYILTDFYNVHYGNAEARPAKAILKAVLSRYHMLVKAKVGFFQRLKTNLLL